MIYMPLCFQSKTAAKVLLLGSESYEDLTDKVAKLEEELRVAKSYQVNFHTRFVKII